MNTPDIRDYARITPIMPNFNFVRIGQIQIWFSYETVIAFGVVGDVPKVRENEWGPTTGKHMNHIGVPAKSRIEGAEFERLFCEFADAVNIKPLGA